MTRPTIRNAWFIVPERRRRSGVVVGLTMVVALLGGVLAHVWAGAQPVGNPGALNLKIDGGQIVLGTQDFDLTPNPLPACSDGEDNDEDGATDYPADAQCSSAVDNSELASGLQPKEDITISGTISAAGVVNVPQSGIYFPPAYVKSGTDVLTARIQPTSAGTGNLNPLTGAATLSITLQVKLEGTPSGVSLGSSCVIGPLSLSMTTGTTNPPSPATPISGVGYNADNGTATLVNNTFSVPGASGCGPLGLANGSINTELGLPSASGKNSASLNGTVNPIVTRGVNASIVPSVTTGAAPLTVNFNGTGSTAVKPIASYAWDFGNGQTATGSTSFTTYSSPGIYTVSLKVTDTDGDSNTKTTTITVGEPPNVAPTAAIATSGSSGTAPFSVQLDGGGSSDPDGTISSYAWNLGNGQTATGPTASATYNSAGSYTVTLTVTDNKGATGTATQVITVAPKPNVPPTANITTVSASGTIPLTVNLSGASSTDTDGTISTYAWDLGNGQTANGVSAQAIYTAAGEYTVSLTVTDNQGGTNTKTLVINVSEDPNLAPSAAVSASTNAGVAPLSVSFDGSASSDVDGTIISYAWNFGNGQNGTGPTPSATYSVPGTYTATLTVTDNKGATGTASTTVTVSKPANQSPVANLAATPSTGTAPLLVQLSSAGSSDPDGAIATYAWNYGNGNTGSGPSPSAVYNTPGTYVVTLTVTDNDGATNVKSTSVVVNAANQLPVAVIQATPVTGSAPLSVSVNGASSADPDGSIVSYAWTFGNGQTATGPTASTTYTTTGSFQIRLTVTDNRGATRSTTTTVVVSGANARPVAVVSALPTSGPAPLLVQLSAVGSSDADGSIVSYSWNFGNGQTATGLRTQVSYATAGTYTATLTVTDNRGATGTATETIVVDPPLTVTDRVRLQFTGSVGYTFDGPIASGNFTIGKDEFGVTAVNGTGYYTGPNNSQAYVNVSLNRFLWFNAFTGTITVNDPANGLSNVQTTVFFQQLSRPSASSVRGSAAWNNASFQPYTLAFTVDDRA